MHTTEHFIWHHNFCPWSLQSSFNIKEEGEHGLQYLPGIEITTDVHNDMDMKQTLQALAYLIVLITGFSDAWDAPIDDKAEACQLVYLPWIVCLQSRQHLSILGNEYK